MRRRLFLPSVMAVIGLLAAVQQAPAHRAAAQEPQPTLTINQLDATGYPELRAVVTVLDLRGLPVRGLAPAQFQAFDAAGQLAIESVSPGTDENVQLNAVVVIDTSGSMADEPLASAKAAATEFVQRLGPNDRAAIISFSDQVAPVLALTNDKTALSASIAGLEANGGTALYEAVQIAAYLAGSAATQGERAVVVLLSDGKNETQASDATAESSLQIAGGAGIPMYPIAFGSLTDVGYLEQLATVTSAQYRAATTGTVGDVYLELSDLLRSQYLVTVRATREADGSEGSLQLVAFVGPQPATASAAFRRGAAAPPPPAPQGQPTAAQKEAGGGANGNLYALIFGAVVLAAVAGGGGFALLRWQQQRRVEAHQLEVVAPNRRLAAAQGVPRRTGSFAGQGVGTAVAGETGTGRLVERGGEGRTVDIGAGPLILGTSSRACQIVLHDGGTIAPEHARIWLRGRRYVLHHVGGMSRKTLVNGQEADWVALDPGDEIVIGRWRFMFEDNEPEPG